MTTERKETQEDKGKAKEPEQRDKAQHDPVQAPVGATPADDDTSGRNQDQQGQQ